MVYFVGCKGRRICPLIYNVAFLAGSGLLFGAQRPRGFGGYATQ